MTLNINKTEERLVYERWTDQADHNITPKLIGGVARGVP